MVSLHWTTPGPSAQAGKARLRHLGIDWTCLNTNFSRRGVSGHFFRIIMNPSLPSRWLMKPHFMQWHVLPAGWFGPRLFVRHGLFLGLVLRMPLDNPSCHPGSLLPVLPAQARLVFPVFPPPPAGLPITSSATPFSLQTETSWSSSISIPAQTPSTGPASGHPAV